MKFETLKFEEISAGVGLLKLNRPKALNALNSQLLTELETFLNEVEKELNLRVLVITGEGEKSFVAGADIKEFEGLSAKEATELSLRGQKIFSQIESLSCPVIACVNGFALGGGMELALACDFILASENANFGLPEVTLGLIPGYGGTQRLARSIGAHRAKMITFTGDIYSAEELKQWGLVSQLFSADDLLDETIKRAKRIASRAPLAVSRAKKAVNGSRSFSYNEGFDFEREQFGELFETEDVKIGVSAFINKQKADFIGK